MPINITSDSDAHEEETSAEVKEVPEVKEDQDLEEEE
ncbi:MAG: hypothetical protein K0S04_881 [Herbinix sp.]|nr:hypothetical protein [Herbinix sp.]